MVNKPIARSCWATLLTKSSYLPGTLVMHASLLKYSQYPLVVYVTPSLPNEAREVLKQVGVITRDIEYLEPEKKEGEEALLDDHDHRFADTWTKLRCFELVEYERVIMVDSDMLARGPMDELMTMDLPAGWIAASHVCACNPRKLKHYPKDWIPENCAHTLAHFTTPLAVENFTKPTHYLLNSGLVILTPSHETFARINHILQTSPLVPTFKFPDQDLLALVFQDKFMPLGYQYNALKTLRSCHKDMWREEDVRNIHFIIDKPWEGQLGQDHVNGYTHGLWWEAWEELDEKNSGVKGWEIVKQGVKDKLTNGP